jgi:hypothetical protein
MRARLYRNAGEGEGAGAERGLNDGRGYSRLYSWPASPPLVRSGMRARARCSQRKCGRGRGRGRGTRVERRARVFPALFLARFTTTRSQRNAGEGEAIAPERRARARARNEGRTTGVGIPGSVPGPLHHPRTLPPPSPPPAVRQCCPPKAQTATYRGGVPSRSALFCGCRSMSPDNSPPEPLRTREKEALNAYPVPQPRGVRRTRASGIR